MAGVAPAGQRKGRVGLARAKPDSRATLGDSASGFATHMNMEWAHRRINGTNNLTSAITTLYGTPPEFLK